MKVADLLKTRRSNWHQLEQMCNQMQHRRKRSMGAPAVTKFAALYRAACADLALADAYQLPPNTVQYLHRLVGQAHNQLYRSRMFHVRKWGRILLVDVPRRVFHDRCVQFCFCAFWGVFLLSAYLAASPDVWPSYVEWIVGEDTIDMLEMMYSKPAERDASGIDSAMTGFYIQHNTSIGLKCFAGGLLVIPGIYETLFNAAFLGAVFGHMARPDVPQSENFFTFVTAHGPFELTAIALSAGAGLRLGMAWLVPRRWSPGLRADGSYDEQNEGEAGRPTSSARLSRLASLRVVGWESMPIMGAAMVMFFLAAIIEGFISPSNAPYEFKATIAIVSACLLVVYFVVLGYPKGTASATR